MAIRIIQVQEKWRIEIEKEEWEFPDRATMEAELKRLFDLKDTFGKIKRGF